MSDTNELNRNNQDYCNLCKEGTDNGIKAACGKSNRAMWIAGILLGVCFGLSGIAWSAKSAVANMAKQVDEIHAEQKIIGKSVAKFNTFIELLMKGQINLPKPRPSVAEEP